MSFSVITLSSSDDEEMSVFSPAPSSVKSSTTAPVRTFSAINLPKSTTLTYNGMSSNNAESNVNIVLPRDRGLLTSFLSSEPKPGPRFSKDLSCTLINGNSDSMTVQKGKSARKSAANNSKNHVTVRRVNSVEANRTVAKKSVGGGVVKKTAVVNRTTLPQKEKEKDSNRDSERNEVGSSDKAQPTNHVTQPAVKKDARNKVAMKSKVLNSHEKTVINHVSHKAKNEDLGRSDANTHEAQPKVKEDSHKAVIIENKSSNSGATLVIDHVVSLEMKSENSGQCDAKTDEAKEKVAINDELPQEVNKEDCAIIEENNSCTSDASRTKEVVKRATARKRTSYVDPPPAKKPRLPPICGRKLFNRFLSFISTRLKVSAEEETKILNRLEHSFNETDQEFVEGRDFYYLILGTVKKIKANEKLLYMYIEDVREELRFRDRRHGETGASDEVKTVEEPAPPTSNAGLEPQPSTSSIGSEQPIPSTSVAGSEPNPSTSMTNTSPVSEDQLEQDSRRARLIEMLKGLLRKLDRRIQKLQNRELDLDDLEKEDSAYLREDSLKKKFMKTWDLLCKVEKCSTNAGREVHKKYHYSGTIYQEINKEVEKLVNKQRVFPNFCDILDIIRSYCERTCLVMAPAQMHKLAEEVFSNVGNDLKNRRIRDDQDTLGSYLLCGSETFDPADADDTLKRLLEESAVEGEKKIQNVIDHYANKQIELKLEPEEGQDDHSSRDSDEEDNENEDSDINSVECSSDSSESDVLSDREVSLPKEKEAEEKKEKPRTPCPPSSSDEKTVDCIVLSD